MGLDRLTPLLLLAVAAVACASAGRPSRLVDGTRARTFAPVPGGVLTSVRVVPHARLDACLFRGEVIAPDAVVVERVGVEGESLTAASDDGLGVYACDGGADPAGERPASWCGDVFGVVAHGRLLDPRLDVICRDPDGRPLAYAFVDPLPDTRWVAVQQDGYVEVYETLGGLPVRVATTRGIDTAAARAVLDVSQYDRAGRELVRRKLEATVAG